MMREVVLLLTVALLSTCFGAQYSNKPRIRREWRTLTESQRHAIAEAMWIVKDTPTLEGRDRYGDRFINHDDLVLMHACSIKDPRCDQGHIGPQFMTFHRAFLLAWENSVLSVLHSMDNAPIDAMPYWNPAYDSIDGIYRNDPNNYIFTDKFLGDFIGNPDYDYAVTNGLFAFWPIKTWTEEQHDKISSLGHVQCVKESWYKGSKATVCDECCGRPKKECDCSSGTFRYFLRADDDLVFNRPNDHSCTPYLRRNTWEAPAPNGIHDIQEAERDYDVCRNPRYIRSWMDWQNCIEIGQPSCLLLAAGIGNICRDRMNKLTERLKVTDILSFTRKMMFRTQIPLLCTACNYSGSYKTSDGKEKGKTNVLHSAAHLALGGDMADVLTSPNDPGVFFGYHGNIDRNNMDWMISTHDELGGDFWGYPKSNRDFDRKDRFKLSGPWPLYPAVACTFEPKAYGDYKPFSSPWLEGTTLDEVVNPGFPVDNLFDTPPANGWGYTHREILYHTSPQRTPYTYDTLAHYYYYDDDDYDNGNDPGYRTRRTNEIQPLEAVDSR